MLRVTWPHSAPKIVNIKCFNWHITVNSDEQRILPGSHRRRHFGIVKQASHAFFSDLFSLIIPPYLYFSAVWRLTRFRRLTCFDTFILYSRGFILMPHFLRAVSSLDAGCRMREFRDYEINIDVASLLLLADIWERILFIRLALIFPPTSQCDIVVAEFLGVSFPRLSRLCTFIGKFSRLAFHFSIRSWLLDFAWKSR